MRANMSVLAPIASAIVAMAVAAKAGVRARVRMV